MARLSANVALRAVAIALALLGPAGFHRAGTAHATPPVEAPRTPVEAQDAGGVDPDPGARGPFVGHSPHAFYDVDARIERVRQEIPLRLKGAPAARAMRGLADIEREEKSQIARHGTLLDWARENLNHRLDLLTQDFPTLAARQ